MTPHRIVSREAWLQARLDLLQKEKAHTRARDELTRQRQALPWLEVTTPYVFDSAAGPTSLLDLFGPRQQLLVQHFMFGTDWDAGCKSCSFMADHMDRAVVHLAARDVSFAAVSVASLDKLLAYRARMGWDFNWVSSGGNGFNRDFHVTFTEEELSTGSCHYNYRDGVAFPVSEGPGISAFAKGDDGKVYHCYSVYGRGLENVMTAYDLLDMVPRGRDEDGQGMAWLRRRDDYA